MADCCTYLEHTLNIITLNVNLIIIGTVANYPKWKKNKFIKLYAFPQKGIIIMFSAIT